MNKIIPSPNDYIKALYLDPQLRSQHTRAAYASQLRQFDLYREGAPLSVFLIESYLSFLQQSGASASRVHQAASAIRWLARLGIKMAYDREPENAEKIEAALLRLLSIPDPKMNDPEPVGRHLDNEEIKSLLAACEDGTPAGARDAAMIALAHGTGARNEEIRWIKIKDLSFENPQSARLKISRGKGGKSRTLILHPPLLDRLNLWMDFRGVEGEWLFCRLEKSGKPRINAPLSGAGTRHILKRRFGASDISRRIAWHDFRRTLIGNLLSRGVDRATIKKITGHTTDKMIDRYDRRSEEIVADALLEIQGDIRDGHE